MSNFLEKVNNAYASGINNSRFQEAINEMIINPENEIGQEQIADRNKEDEGR